MPPSDLRLETILLMNRMIGPPPSDPRFVGPPVDPARIDPLALGDLWAIAHATDRSHVFGRVKTLASETARFVLERARTIEPAFRASACRDNFEKITRESEDEKDKQFDHVRHFPWQRACFFLRRCIDLSPDELGPVARRFLAVNDWCAMPHLALAMARLVNPPFAAQALETLAADLEGSPLLLEEVRLSGDLDLPANIVLADVAYPARSGDDGEAHHPLSGYPAYVAFAEKGLRLAVARAREIHDFKRPYASDKAFTLDESSVVQRLARLALDRDEPWVPTVLDELFRKASVAPTAAKTLPSQSVAYGLGRAIEALPTPEMVETLRVVLGEVRHAGVKLKLQRNLRGAERGLAGRPEIALRMPLDRPIGKPQVATLTRCLEAGLAFDLTMTPEVWRARMAAQPQTRMLARSLLWALRDPDAAPVTVLPVEERGSLVFQDITGETVVPAPTCRVGLWHPLSASDGERDAWRDRVAALRIKQPFKQVFREFYVVPVAEMAGTRTAMFFGHVIAARPFLGLARRERWTMEYDTLARSFGPWTARLDLNDPIYPGCDGWTTIRDLALWTSGGRKAVEVPLADVPATALSEILRAVDLLASTSSFALTDPEDLYARDTRLRHIARSPMTAMLDMRKQALDRALRGLDGLADMSFDARLLRLGAYAIHLATGRVTRDGEPVTIDPPKSPRLAAVPWLPHDERLLETIFYTAVAIARGSLGDDA